MDALASAYSDDDGSGSDCGAADSSPHRREESETPGGAAKRPRLAPLEAPHRTVAEMHVESLVRLQSECPLLPSESAAEARRAQWKWFRNICDAEFSDAIGAEAGTGIGLQLFGSWSYDMWVSSSDFDANMFMLSRIPNFFPRLKRAVLAAHPSAEVDIAASARVPVARVKCGERGSFDVTHECGRDNLMALHDSQIQRWAEEAGARDVAVRVAIRVIKLWAAARALNNPRKGSLTSLAYLVMLLAISQRRPPPHAQDSNHHNTSGPHTSRTDGEKEEASGNQEGGGADPWEAERDSRVRTRAVELLGAFFSEYADVGSRTVISAPSGAVKSEGRDLDHHRLASVASDPSHRGVGLTLLIQDPFLPEVNLGRFVDRQSVKILRAALAKSAALFRSEDPIVAANLLQLLVEPSRALSHTNHQ
ncbi:hypothetical protein T484DRAFT_1955718 [Baffinella frigidus]|nr:hypothetical protein T484DRAFT_1955718 [Cryptophyta sp. CCMP2293]